MEYNVGLRVENREDLQEGVAAVLVRKDFKPIWNPPTVDAVEDKWCDTCFSPSAPLPFHQVN